MSRSAQLPVAKRTPVHIYYERLSPFFQGARGRDDFAQVVTRARARETAFAAAVS